MYLAADVNLGEFVRKDQVVDYLDILWRDPTLDPILLLTQELRKRVIKVNLTTMPYAKISLTT